MLGKILFFVLLILVLLALWSKRKRELSKDHTRSSESKKMVRCPVCGVHFIEVDGEWYDGVMYCSKDCLLKGRKDVRKTSH